MFKSTCFISRSEAEKTYYNKVKPCLISIVSPDDDTEPMDLHENAWSAVLYLRFHDVDPKGCSEEWKRKYRLFGFEDAKAVIAFLDANEESNEAVWVHCEAGISRSAGVAKFIAERYRLPFNEGYSLYNKHVYRTLVNVYYNSYNEEQE